MTTTMQLGFSFESAPSTPGLPASSRLPLPQPPARPILPPLRVGSYFTERGRTYQVTAIDWAWGGGTGRLDAEDLHAIVPITRIITDLAIFEQRTGLTVVREADHAR